jgi:hypothetical protein
VRDEELGGGGKGLGKGAGGGGRRRSDCPVLGQLKTINKLIAYTKF